MDGEISINKTAVIILIAMMFIYSAIKIRAKVPDLYSVLKPETSSDSPSLKSNGVRLVSAKDVINHITNKGHIIRKNRIVFLFENQFILREFIKIKGDRITKAILTS